MSRCLSHDLIKYENDEEAKFVDEASQDKDGCDKEFLRQMYSATKVTVDDLNRVYSPEEIRQLCLRTKVRVNMSYFNCALDIKKYLEKKGRLKDRSERFINAMIVKGVTRNPQLPSSPREISRARDIRQCLLKKQNNMRLDRWRKESQRTAEKQSLVEQTPMEQGSIEDCPMEHLQVEQSQTVEQSPSLQLAQTPNEVQSKESPMEQHPIEDCPMEHLQVEQSQTVEQSPSLQLAQTPNEVQSKESSVANIIYPTSVDSGQSQELPLIQQHADEADIDWLQAGNNINTESLTYGESADINILSSQSENQPLTQVSEYDDNEEANVAEDYDCRSDTSGTNSELFRCDMEPQPSQKDILQPCSQISEDYNAFNTQVPCTSTQTPESELNP